MSLLGLPLNDAFANKGELERSTAAAYPKVFMIQCCVEEKDKVGRGWLSRSKSMEKL